MSCRLKKLHRSTIVSCLSMCVTELSVGWVHPRVGFGSVGFVGKGSKACAVVCFNWLMGVKCQMCEHYMWCTYVTLCLVSIGYVVCENLQLVHHCVISPKQTQCDCKASYTVAVCFFTMCICSRIITRRAYSCYPTAGQSLLDVRGLRWVPVSFGHGSMTSTGSAFGWIGLHNFSVGFGCSDDRRPCGQLWSDPNPNLQDLLEKGRP